MASITPPSRPAHTFGYTPVDLEDSYTPPDLGIGNVATTYAYNPDRQLTTITRPDGQTVSLGYDPTAGRLSTLTEPRGVTTFSYHPTSGQIASIASPGGTALSYTFDGSLLTGTTWTGLVAGSVTRTYSAVRDLGETAAGPLRSQGRPSQLQAESATPRPSPRTHASGAGTRPGGVGRPPPRTLPPDCAV